MRAIFTVGELIQYAPKEIDSKIFNMLRGLVAANKIDSDVNQINVDQDYLVLDISQFSVHTIPPNKDGSKKCARSFSLGTWKDECCGKFI